MAVAETLGRWNFVSFSGVSMSSARIGQKKIAVRAARLSPEERRSHLLSCAVQAFAEYGIASANHSHIAKMAKVSVPTVFFYFKTKEALVDAVLTEIERFYFEIFGDANADPRGAIDVLNDLTYALAQTLDASQEAANYTRVLRDWSVAVRMPIWPRYLAFHHHMTEVFSELIARGQREGDLRTDIEPHEEALILNATSSALIQLMETGADQAQIDRLRHSSIQSMLSFGKTFAMRRPDTSE